MAGLPTNSNSNALQQLYRLFEGRGGERSPRAGALAAGAAPRLADAQA